VQGGSSGGGGFSPLHPAVLTGELSRAHKPLRILRLLVSHSACLSLIHLSAALTALARCHADPRFAPGGRAAEVFGAVRRRAVATLCSADDVEQRSDVGLWACVLDSSASAALPLTAWEVSQLHAVALQALPAADAPRLAALASLLERAGAPPGPALAAALAEGGERQLATAPLHCTLGVMRAFCGWGLPPPPALAAAAEGCALRALCLPQPDTLLAVVDAWASSGWPHSQRLPAVAGCALAGCLPALDATDAANLLTACLQSQLLAAQLLPPLATAPPGALQRLPLGFTTQLLRLLHRTVRAQAGWGSGTRTPNFMGLQGLSSWQLAARKVAERRLHWAVRQGSRAPLPYAQAATGTVPTVPAPLPALPSGPSGLAVRRCGTRRARGAVPAAG
jgi:hypothetical protein